MKKKLIIFDLDGTLIDTLSDIEHIFNYVLIKNGLGKKSKNFNAKKTYVFECMFLLMLDHFGFPKCLPNPTFSRPFLKTLIL